MQVNTPDSAPDYVGGNLRTGTLNSKVLLEGQEGTLNNYRFSWEHAGADKWETPRHRHNFDQIRLQVQGSFSFAKGQSLTAGWVAYFPESVHYGPQVREADSVTAVLQFGGASRNGFMSPRERKAGFDALRSRGAFDKGAFTYFDEKGQRHNRDAFEAVWEEVRGRKLVYAEPRYQSLVNMPPSAYQWVPQGNGIAVKRLGTFTENQVSVSFIRLDAGATVTVGRHTAPEVLFLVKGRVSAQGQEHGVHTAFGLEANEGATFIKAVQESDLFYVELPRFPNEAVAGQLAA